MLFARAKEMERGNASIEEARGKILAQIGKLRSETLAIHRKVIVKEQISGSGTNATDGSSPLMASW